MLHLDQDEPPTPRLLHRGSSALPTLAVSAALHLTAVMIVGMVTLAPGATDDAGCAERVAAHETLDVRHIVFLAPDPQRIGGGGGGGNQQPGPIRRAQGVAPI
ncbi:MAG TPA: hypothetical protein VGI12_18265 [Vicinamibacterales bacterium]